MAASPASMSIQHGLAEGSVGDIPEMTGHPIGDKAARQRFISRSLWLTVPGTLLVIGTLYRLVPPLEGVETLEQRLALTLRWLFVAMLPYAAVCLTILVRRFFEGAHNPLAGGESEALRIHGRVLANTLEQLVWLAFCLLALATLLEPAQMRLVPVACVFFVVARLVYWWGYLRSGTLGRAPGVQLTFSLNVALLVLAAYLLTRSLLAGRV
jgi:uncharacterized membrane protein YecN with MAPEG domain